MGLTTLYTVFLLISGVGLSAVPGRRGWHPSVAVSAADGEVSLPSCRPERLGRGQGRGTLRGDKSG